MIRDSLDFKMKVKVGQIRVVRGIRRPFRNIIFYKYDMAANIEKVKIVVVGDSGIRYVLAFSYE